MRMVLAAGRRDSPGLSQVMVANSRAHEEYPIKDGDESVGNGAKNEYVERPHAAFK